MDVDAVFEERYWYPDDGSIVWLSGYVLVGDDGRYLARDAPQLAERGLIVTSVAGAAHHAQALRCDAADPGRPLRLRRDAANQHDPNAIAVHVAAGEQLGWVPRAIAAELAAELDAGTPWAALALRDSRPSPRDARAGLTMLLARGGALTLRERPRSGPRSAA